MARIGEQRMRPGFSEQKLRECLLVHSGFQHFFIVCGFSNMFDWLLHFCLSLNLLPRGVSALAWREDSRLICFLVYSALLGF